MCLGVNVQASPEKFSELLTEAIYHIRLHESKSLQIVQDELGYAIGREGGSAITYWRRGNVPGKLSDLEHLTQVLINRGGFGSEWVQKFMIAGGYPEKSSQAFVAKETTTTPAAQSVSSLPRNMYRHLIGRGQLVQDVMDALRDKEGRWCIGLDGLGGIGKTAVALEVTKQSQSLFKHVVWLTAAKQQIGPQANENTQFTFDTVLNGIARQLAMTEVIKLPQSEKEKRLQTFMQYEPTLIVLDNLETADEPQTEIIKQLKKLLNPSKALLTSRHRFQNEVYALHLTGIDEHKAAQFIQQDAQEKGIQQIQHAQPAELESIFTVTDGSPLAMKLIISQLNHLPLDIVLQHLQEATPVRQLYDGDEYINFYKFVFFRSWALLNDEAKHLLVALTRFEPSNGCDFTALKQISALPHPAIISSLDALWQLSLLEIGEIESLSQIRYYLHALTRYFVLSDIVQILGE